jgi:hypothetical protein
MESKRVSERAGMQHHIREPLKPLREGKTLPVNLGSSLFELRTHQTRTQNAADTYRSRPMRLEWPIHRSAGSTHLLRYT